MNYELSGSELKFNWKLIKSELKVKFMDEHSNE
jgi:hypothetical protein